MRSASQLVRVLLSVFILLGIASVHHLFAAEQVDVIEGAVIKTEEGIIIEGDDADYLVQGKDLSDMVGKVVEATGIIRETKNGFVIQVQKVEELQE